MSDVYSLIESVCKPKPNINDLRELFIALAKQHEVHNCERHQLATADE